MGRKLKAGIAVIGVALAGALLKGMAGSALEYLGWIGLLFGIGLIVAMIWSWLSDSSPSEPPPPPEPLDA